jgi:hypothetical protein
MQTGFSCLFAPDLQLFSLHCLAGRLWYAPGAQTCYFKSTDGHASNWQFSTVRLNW